jgi:hypothetical protein
VLTKNIYKFNLRIFMKKLAIFLFALSMISASVVAHGNGEASDCHCCSSKAEKVSKAPAAGGAPEAGAKGTAKYVGDCKCPSDRDCSSQRCVENCACSKK